MKKEPSAKQIKARENFVKNYAQKKKGSKSTKPKTNRKKDKYDKLYEADRRAFKKMTKSGNKVMARLQKLKIKVIKKNGS